MSEAKKGERKRKRKRKKEKGKRKKKEVPEEITRLPIISGWASQ